ncbi:hypothetical protein J6590_024163 [Homalodisca vitripennis]|nr:hypothetical protein J6590_024163 [Homalodisca vitripennis]
MSIKKDDPLRITLRSQMAILGDSRRLPSDSTRLVLSPVVAARGDGAIGLFKLGDRVCSLPLSMLVLLSQYEVVNIIFKTYCDGRVQDFRRDRNETSNLADFPDYKPIPTKPFSFTHTKPMVNAMITNGLILPSCVQWKDFLALALLSRSGIDNKHSTILDNKHSTILDNKYSIILDNKHSTILDNKYSIILDNKHSTILGNKHSTILGNKHSIILGNKYSTLLINDPTVDRILLVHGKAQDPPKSNQIKLKTAWEGVTLASAETGFLLWTSEGANLLRYSPRAGLSQHEHSDKHNLHSASVCQKERNSLQTKSVQVGCACCSCRQSTSFLSTEPQTGFMSRAFVRARAPRCPTVHARHGRQMADFFTARFRKWPKRVNDRSRKRVRQRLICFCQGY